MWKNYIYLTIIIIILFAPVTYVSVNRPLPSDYAYHNVAAQKIAETGNIAPPYFLRFVLVALMYKFIGLNLFSASMIVTLFFHVLLGLILFYFLLKVIPKNSSQIYVIFCMALTLALMIVAPITFLTWWRHRFYFGYVSMNLYHNDTYIAMQPFAFFLFMIATAHFYKSSDNQYRNIVLIAGLVMLSALAKPSYLICILPGIVLFAIYQYLQGKQSINISMLILGIVIPSLLILAWQYYFAFSDYQVAYGAHQPIEEKAKIIIAPFQVILGHTRWFMIPIQFVLSIAFPLYVYITYFQKAKDDLRFNLAWSMFTISMLYFYIFAESGSRMQAGNFGWGTKICLFILFVYSTLFFIKEHGIETLLEKRHAWSQKMYGAVGLFGLHFISGVGWYIFNCVSELGYK